MAFKDFTHFTVWQKASELLLEVYDVSKKFPKDERFGMISDIRRAAGSVVHNIAEGFGRYERRDKTRFYKISRGSAYEVISQVLTAGSLRFLDENETKQIAKGYQDIIDELDKLIKTVETRP